MSAGIALGTRGATRRDRQAVVAAPRIWGARAVGAGGELSEPTRLPQASLREDRLSVLEGVGLPDSEAMRVELAHGRRSLAAADPGIARFREGAGRHGLPEDA